MLALIPCIDDNLNASRKTKTTTTNPHHISNKEITPNSERHRHVYLSMVEESLQIGSHVVFHLLQSSPFFPQRAEGYIQNQKDQILGL